ncbi:MAG: DUF3748 domain-containing protein, partial [Planctomycetota bacterium]
DDKWLAYDTRNDSTGIGGNSNIEMVNLATGEVVVLYETENQTEYGPGCGSVDFHPFENKVLFIHGVSNCDKQRPYSFSRRTCAIVDTAQPGKVTFLDARDVTYPFTAGALRGGTHAHQWSADGKWIGFTYNDAIRGELEKRMGSKHDMRTVGVANNIKRVSVDKDSQRENVNGKWFAALVAKVTAEPKPGSDEIDKAFSDSWVGTDGYRKADGSLQRARAFLGNTRNSKGKLVTELFVVDIPDRINIPGNDGPLEGTMRSFPMPPKGTVQRRLTHTQGRKYPGIATETRHWPRSTPDGSWISFLARDDKGVIQIFLIAPVGGNPVQLTRHDSDIQSSPNISYDGKYISYVCDNSIYITSIEKGPNFGKSTRLTLRSKKAPLCPEFSHDGNKIVYNRQLPNGRNSYYQIFVIELQ